MKFNNGFELASFTVVVVAVVVSRICLNVVFVSSPLISLFMSGTASKDLKLTSALFFSSIIFSSSPTLKKSLG